MSRDIRPLPGVLREPLLHFLLLGAALFALYAAFGDDKAPVPANRIEVTQADVARLAGQFEATWRRPPSGEERAALIDAFVREEILVREARALGLDRDDTAVRQRLAQKMQFLAESGAEAAEATDAELLAHLEAHPERFQRQAAVAMEQVFLGSDAAAAADGLAALRAGAAPDTLGAPDGPNLLPARFPLSPASVIDGAFGRGVFARVAALEPGVWDGPVASAFGLHAVRLQAFEPAELPPLETIRGMVIRDWRAARRAALAEARFEALAARYVVIRPRDPELR